MSTASHRSKAEFANLRMVNRLIVKGALWSGPVIEAFRRTPRHLFLDRVYWYRRRRRDWIAVDTRSLAPRALRLMYLDQALVTRLELVEGRYLPLSSSSQPSLMAQMLQDLWLEPGLNVLEIGTGTGYNAALLSWLVAPDGRVTSVDVDRDLVEAAARRLETLGDRSPVQLVHGDGRHGWPAEAPFDRIVVTASSTDIEPAWRNQLADQALLLVPIQFAPGVSYLFRGSRRDGGMVGDLVHPAYFLPLRSNGDRTPPAEQFDWTAARTLRPPWGNRFASATTGTAWIKFSLALAFFAWVEGLDVTHEADSRGHLRVRVGQDPHSANWFGPLDWKVLGGAAAQDLGLRLVKRFLDAGAPRPSEYRIRVVLASDVASLRQDYPFVRRRDHYFWCLRIRKTRIRTDGY